MIPRHWFRCSLKQLLLLFVLCSIALGAFTYAKRRGRAVDALERMGAKVTYQGGGTGWLDTIFGRANVMDVDTVDFDDTQLATSRCAHFDR
jgi:hypothetical protein